MNTSFSIKQLTQAVACALALGFASGAVQAQMGSTTADANRMLWTEATKTQVWRNPQGLCWQSPYGPPPGYGECNPAPIAQYVAPPPPPPPAPAPVYVAPPPPPPPAPVYVAPAPLPVKKDRN